MFPFLTFESAFSRNGLINMNRMKNSEAGDIRGKNVKQPAFKWHQLDGHIVISFLVQNVRDESTTVQCNGDTITFQSSDNDGQHYYIRIPLAHAVKANCETNVMKSKVEVILSQIDGAHWETLERKLSSLENDLGESATNHGNADADNRKLSSLRRDNPPVAESDSTNSSNTEILRPSTAEADSTSSPPPAIPEATKVIPDGSPSAAPPVREVVPQKAPGALRARHHNHIPGVVLASEADRRSEASSEQTRVSKFKVVKLESKAPYCRGRWQCFDFHDRPRDQSKTSNADRISSSEQSTASTTVSTANIPVAGPLITSDTVPESLASAGASLAGGVQPQGKTSKFRVTAVPSVAPVPASASSTLTDNIVLTEVEKHQQHPVETIGTEASMDSATSSSSGLLNGLLNGKKSDTNPDVFMSDSNAALSAELSRRTTIDTGSANHEASGITIEHKIRQCMDLVSNHLMIAVRGELEQVSGELQKMRAQVEQLEFENNALRSENAILRQTAGTEPPSRSQPSRRK